MALEAMKHEARVTSKGQVTIPKQVRRALRIRAGDALIFEMDEEGVRE
jgi:AbrB family looped-hinge helix DNA binding protein